MVTLLPELARLDAGEPRFNAIVQKAFTAMTLLALPIVGMALCGTEMMERARRQPSTARRAGCSRSSSRR